MAKKDIEKIHIKYSKNGSEVGSQYININDYPKAKRQLETLGYKVVVVGK
jgi:hypothetical protein